jgi:hypothetical protein
VQKVSEFHEDYATISLNFLKKLSLEKMRRVAKVRFEIGSFVSIPRVVLFLSAQKLLHPIMHGEKLK